MSYTTEEVIKDMNDKCTPCPKCHGRMEFERDVDDSKIIGAECTFCGYKEGDV